MTRQSVTRHAALLGAFVVAVVAINLAHGHGYQGPVIIGSLVLVIGTVIGLRRTAAVPTSVPDRFWRHRSFAIGIVGACLALAVLFAITGPVSGSVLFGASAALESYLIATGKRIR